MIPAYAIVKKAAALVNHKTGRLDNTRKDLIVRVCDEILAGQHLDQFPLHVWMTGSGTQFNMNVNEVISNRCSQITGQPLGSHRPVHPNDHVNMSQSSNDSFPAARNVAAAVGHRRHRGGDHPRRPGRPEPDRPAPRPDPWRPGSVSDRRRAATDRL